MQTTNDHEQELARLADQIALEGTLGAADFAEIMKAVDFVMSTDDVKFLARYIQWRMANPIPK